MGATMPKQKQQTPTFRTRCSRADCHSNAPPTHTPSLLLFDAAQEKLPEVRLQGLVACESCANAYSSPNDIVSDSMWESLCQQIAKQGKPRPVRSLTKVQWSRMNNVTPEFQAQLAVELGRLISQVLDAHRVAPTAENAQEILAAMTAVGVNFCTTVGMKIDEVGQRLIDTGAALRDVTDIAMETGPCLAVTEHDGHGFACTKPKGHEDEGDIEHACEVVDIGGTTRVEHRWAGDTVQA